MHLVENYIGVGLDDLELLHDVLTRVNAAALAAGALDDRKDFR
jgi:MarR family transcriptional regulator, organic hydroperoxide resistance regulator